MSHILLVARDNSLRESRAKLIEQAGHAVRGVMSAREAITQLESEPFDLVVVGRHSPGDEVSIDRALREAFPQLKILKIANAFSEEPYVSRTVDASPVNFLAAINDMV
jgi:DNA-binding NtrC family response regulator